MDVRSAVALIRKADVNFRSRRKQSSGRWRKRISLAKKGFPRSFETQTDISGDDSAVAEMKSLQKEKTESHFGTMRQS